METSDNPPGLPLSSDSPDLGEIQDWEGMLASMDLGVVDYGQLEQPALDSSFGPDPLQGLNFPSQDSQYFLGFPTADTLDAGLDLDPFIDLNTTPFESTTANSVPPTGPLATDLVLAGFPSPSEVPCLSPDLMAVPPLLPSASLTSYAEQVISLASTVGTIPEQWFAGGGTWMGTFGSDVTCDLSPPVFSPETVVSPAGSLPWTLPVPDQTTGAAAQLQDRKLDRRKGKRTAVSMSSREYRRLFKPVKCLDEKCAMRFSFDAERNKHVNARHPALARKENVYRPRCKCETCGKSFARPDHRRRHMRNKHPPTPPGSASGSDRRTRSGPRVLVALCPKERL